MYAKENMALLLRIRKVALMFISIDVTMSVRNDEVIT